VRETASTTVSEGLIERRRMVPGVHKCLSQQTTHTKCTLNCTKTLRPATGVLREATSDGKVQVIGDLAAYPSIHERAHTNNPNAI